MVPQLVNKFVDCAPYPLGLLVPRGLLGPGARSDYRAAAQCARWTLAGAAADTPTWQPADKRIYPLRHRMPLPTSLHAWPPLPVTHLLALLTVRLNIMYACPPAAAAKLRAWTRS